MKPTGGQDTGLQARPIYHRKRDSTEAHLTIVFAALAISCWPGLVGFLRGARMAARAVGLGPRTRGDAAGVLSLPLS
jgi:hypothetical protein